MFVHNICCGGRLVSGVSYIPMFYDWVPYHYGFLSFDGRIPTYFWWVESNISPRGILIILRHLVPGIWSVKQLIKHAMMQYIWYYTYMRETNLWYNPKHQTETHTKRKKLFHKITDPIGAYIASLVTLGKIYYKEVRHEKLAITS